MSGIQINVHNIDLEETDSTGPVFVFERPLYSIGRNRPMTSFNTVLHHVFPDGNIGYEMVLPIRNIDMSRILQQSMEDGELQRGEKIIRIGTKRITEAGQTCTICSDTFLIGEEVGKLTCEHVYHKNCIIEWGRYKQECPVCREPIPVQQQQEDIPM